MLKSGFGKRYSTYFGLFIVGISILIIVRDIAALAYSKYVLVVFCALFFAVLTYEELVYATFFLMPLLCGIPSTYIMLFDAVLLIFKASEIKIRTLVYMFIWIFLELLNMLLLNMLWVKSPDYIEVVKYLAHVCVLFQLILNTQCADYEKCVFFYVMGTILLCAVVIIKSFMNTPSNWLWLFQNGWFRIGITAAETTEMALTLNANSLAYYSLVGIACGFAELSLENKKHKTLYILTIILCAITGVLTVSRSFLLMMVVICILAFWGNLKKPKVLLISLCIAVVGTYGAISVLKNYPEIWDGIEARFTSSTFSTAGGRTVIMQKYLEAFLSSPQIALVGAGATSYKDVIGFTESLHNGTEQILVCYGLLGAIAFVVGLLFPIFELKQKKKGLPRWLPFIAVVLFVQTIQFVNPPMLMMPYAVAVYILKIGETDAGEEILNHC